MNLDRHTYLIIFLMNTKQVPRKKETGRLFFSIAGCVNVVTLDLLHYDNVQVAPLAKLQFADFKPGDFGTPVTVSAVLRGVVMDVHAPTLAALTVAAPCANSTSALLE